MLKQKPIRSAHLLSRPRGRIGTAAEQPYYGKYTNLTSNPNFYFQLTFAVKVSTRSYDQTHALFTVLRLTHRKANLARWIHTHTTPSIPHQKKSRKIGDKHPLNKKRQCAERVIHVGRGKRRRSGRVEETEGAIGENKEKSNTSIKINKQSIKARGRKVWKTNCLFRLLSFFYARTVIVGSASYVH